MMTETEFNAYFLEHIKEYLQETMQETEVKVTPILKNNGVLLHGVSFLPSEKAKAMSPTFYLEELYHDVQGGKSVQEVMANVAHDYSNAMKQLPMIEEADITNFDSAKNKIFFQLVNLKANKDMLKTHPHEKVMNLAKIYYLEPVPNAMAKISYDLMEQWGITQEQLDTVALKNTIEQKEPLLTPVYEALKSPVEQCKNYLRADILPKDIFYTMTNREGCFGASAVIYPGVMEKTAELVGGNFYLVPSSLHEMIILPECHIPPRELGRMVREANLTILTDKDMLADCVYKYDRKAKELKVVPESMPRKKEYER